MIEAFTLLENKSIIPLTSELFQIDIPEVNISSLTANQLAKGGLNDSGVAKEQIQNLPLIDVNTYNQIYYTQNKLMGPLDFIINWQIKLPTEGKYIYSYNYGARSTISQNYTENYDIVPSLSFNLLGSVSVNANTLIVETSDKNYMGNVINYGSSSITTLSSPDVYVNVTYYRVS